MTEVGLLSRVSPKRSLASRFDLLLASVLLSVWALLFPSGTRLVSFSLQTVLLQRIYLLTWRFKLLLMVAGVTSRLIPLILIELRFCRQFVISDAENWEKVLDFSIFTYLLGLLLLDSSDYLFFLFTETKLNFFEIQKSFHLHRSKHCCVYFWLQVRLTPSSAD